MTLGEAIRTLRSKQGWNQRQLSEASGVSRQTISDAEQGRHNTSVLILIEILDAMGYELTVSKKVENGKKAQKRRIAEAVIDKAL